MTIGVVWDLGNVLIDWQPLAALTAGLGEEEARRLLEADDFDFMAWNHLQDAGRTWAEGEDDLRRTHPHWVEHVLAYRANFVESLVGEVAGTGELVRRLHDAAVPQVGLTNWSHELYPHAPERFEVLSLLDEVVVSGTERVAKPDPRIYEIAVERIGLPASALVFVDDRQANVDGATAAGLDGILFTGADDLRTALQQRGLPV